MQIEPLSIEGAYVVTPRQFPDERGVFLESFRGARLAEHLGHRPDIVQTNVSVSGRWPRCSARRSPRNDSRKTPRSSGNWRGVTT